MEEILRIEHLSKQFPGVQALTDVQLTLYSGEVLALIGENGAGKSTLMKILLGIYKADGGDIWYGGKKVSFKNPEQALKSGISMIHQEISLIPEMDVSENIWLGRESEFSALGIINIEKRYNATKKLLERLEINIDPHARVKDLSVAGMQLVEVARAVSYNSKILIMDEPTSALATSEILKLYSIMRDLSKKDVAIIFISHKIDEIFEACDRVTVLRDGHYIDTRLCSDITSSELINMIAGRELTELFPKTPAKITDVVLEVRNLCGNHFHDVNFTLHRGEILGFCGLIGSGRTDIMRGIFGVDPASSGDVLIDGKKVNIHSPQQAIHLGIGMITEDRLRQGVIHGLSIKINMTLPMLDRICNFLGIYDRKKEQSRCTKQAEELGVVYSTLNTSISTLSGGNQQKVIIGRWLLTNPKVLIMDEPTRGIDVGAKAEIHRMLSKLAQEGMAILLVSSELPEILGMSDRIMVVREGTIVHECLPKYATQESLMSYAFGVDDERETDKHG